MIELNPNDMTTEQKTILLIEIYNKVENIEKKLISGNGDKPLLTRFEIQEEREKECRSQINQKILKMITDLDSLKKTILVEAISVFGIIIFTVFTFVWNHVIGGK